MLLAGVVSIALIGPGAVSLDHAFGLTYPDWAGVAALGAAAVAGAVVVQSRERVAA